MSTPTVKAIIKALRKVVGPDDVALHQPVFQGNEWEYVKQCLDTTYVSSVGKFVDRFETELAEYVGARRAVAVVNGTAALQVALRLVGVTVGDEVIMPTLTFVATANAAHYLGAIPHFVDSDEETLGLDPLSLRSWLTHIGEVGCDGLRNRMSGRRIKALVPMHVFGHPVDMEGLLAVAHDFGLAVVEDAAESLGSYYQGRHTGTLGKMGAISFNGNKIITSGGGGAIITNDDELANFAKHLTTTAKLHHRWEYQHDEIGYNFRMPNVNAALGCAQLEQISGFIASKRRLYECYREELGGLSGVRLMAEPRNSKSNYWLQTIILDEHLPDMRDELLTVSNDAGLMTRPAWGLMHLLPHYSSCPRAPLDVAESLAKRIINLPSGAGIL